MWIVTLKRIEKGQPNAETWVMKEYTQLDFGSTHFGEFDLKRKRNTWLDLGSTRFGEFDLKKGKRDTRLDTCLTYFGEFDLERKRDTWLDTSSTCFSEFDLNKMENTWLDISSTCFGKFDLNKMLSSIDLNVISLGISELPSPIQTLGYVCFSSKVGLGSSF